MLVRWAEQQRDFSLSDARPHTYLELAKALDPPTHQRVVPTALGLIGHALAELSLSASWTKAKIPDIQLLIWSKGKNRPGDSGLTARLNRSVLAEMSIADKKALSLDIWQEVISYRYWPDVLKFLNLQSLEAEIPDINDTLESIANDRAVAGESPFHQRLKYFVRDNHAILNLNGKFTATTENILLPVIALMCFSRKFALDERS
jgi:hypothetical protein